VRWEAHRRKGTSFLKGSAGRFLALGPFAILFTLLAASPVAALDAAPAGVTKTAPDIVVLIDPLQKSGELEPFRQVIADAARYKLERAGLSPEIAAGSHDADARPQPKAAAVGAAAALVCRYQVQGQEMAVTFGWYDTKASSAAASVEARGEVDLHLDGVIFGALDEILGKVQDRIQALMARKVTETPAPLPPGQKEKPPALEPARVPQPGPSTGAEKPAAPASIRVLVAGGFAPFLPMGAAAYYFGIGYLPSLLVSVLIPTPVGPVGVGLISGMDYFSAAGATDNSQNYLIPIGLDVRYELDAGLFRPFFHLSGGPALLIMQTGTQGTLTDVMPFFRSGIGVELKINSWLGVNTMVDYDIYFEMPFLIMGFSPSVNMAVRL